MTGSTRLVFVLPGGGLRGLVQSTFLAQAEAQVGPLNKVVDLLVGSSVGLITGSLLSAGFPMENLAAMTAAKARTYFPTSWCRRLVNLYRRNGIYDYTEVINDIKAHGFDLRFGDLPVKTMGGAASVNAGVSHFFKSYSESDADRRLTDVLAYAFAAPWYFGTQNCDPDQQTYADSGVGLSNNPVVAAFLEVIALGWTQNTTIVTIGTGRYEDDPRSVPYSITSRETVVGQAKRAIRFGSSESEIMSQSFADFLDTLFPGITVKVVNPVIPDGSKSMGDPRFVSAYQEAGRKAAEGVDFYELFGLQKPV